MSNFGMSRDELNRKLCAIIPTLDEIDFMPEVSLYLALGSDMEKFMEVKAVLITANLAIPNGDNSLSITPTGRLMAAKINAFAAKYH